MSVSYISTPLEESEIKLFMNDKVNALALTEAVTFTRHKAPSDYKSVDVGYVDVNGKVCAAIVFRGYENQKEVGTILKAFSLMLNKKFVEEGEMMEDF